MPRDGSNIYHYPPGTPGIPDTTVASTPYNAFLADIEQDQNTPRPIVAGGTAASSPDGALDNLSAEKFKQVVTNWDSNVWRAGSFYAATTASGAAPVAAHAFAGIAYYANATDFVIEARDLTDPGNPMYVRVMAGGVWGAWALNNGAITTSTFVQKIGDTMTGTLIVPKVQIGPTGLSSQPNSLSVQNPAANCQASVGQDNTNRINVGWTYNATPANAFGTINTSGSYARPIYIDASLLALQSLSGGIVTAPTPAPGDSSTKVATTAFVGAAAAGAVRYDTAQALTAAQQQQARQNVYAAPFDAMAYNGMQINGTFEISQERGLASPVSSGYVCDGWSVGKAGTMVLGAYQQNVPNPYFPGFQNYFVCTVTTAQAVLGAADYVVIIHPVEGYRIVRLQWGTANAQPLTISFWSSHDLPGVYTGVVRNIDNTRSCAFSYTHAVAGLQQYNVVTIPGCPTGTWNATNGIGLHIGFCLAVGSTFVAPSLGTWLNANYVGGVGQINGVSSTVSILRITGVAVFPGNEAPSQARSPYVARSADQELEMCRRYYEVFGDQNATHVLWGYNGAGGTVYWPIPYRVKKRAVPTVSAPVGWTFTNCTSFNVNGSPGLDVVTLYSQVTVLGACYASNAPANARLIIDARL